MVSLQAAERVEQWINEAVADGAKVLAGGTRDGATIAPTVLTDVPAGAKVICNEVFGPVMIIQRVASLEEAFAQVNDSRFGLQAGVFTRSLDVAFRANRELEVGGVIIGDVPSYRADQMPYGGVKDSGVGREGVASAMDDYTFEKVMVLTGISL
jgi:aldehyde dehydrogenase (NAD+)